MAYFCFFLFPLCIDISVFPSPQLTRVNSWSSLIFGRSDIRLAETPTGLWTSERPRMIIIRLNGQGGSGKNIGILAGKRIGRRGEWKYGKWKKEKMFRIHYVWNWPSCCVASALYQGALQRIREWPEQFGTPLASQRPLRQRLTFPWSIARYSWSLPVAFSVFKHLRRLETRQVLRRLTMETKCVQPHFNSQDDIACIIEKLFIVSLLLINLVLMNNCLFWAPW